MLQVYTGDGKGKTTAALGLVLRAAGRNMRVLVLSFMKEGGYGEFALLDSLPGVDHRTFGKPYFVAYHEAAAEAELSSAGEVRVYRPGEAPEAYVRKVEEGVKVLDHALHGANYDLVVADELGVALYYGLADLPRVLAVCSAAQGSTDVELVVTGRNTPRELIDAADLVTELRCVKHYFERGVAARDGIEF